MNKQKRDNLIFNKQIITVQSGQLLGDIQLVDNTTRNDFTARAKGEGVVIYHYAPEFINQLMEQNVELKLRIVQAAKDKET